MEREPLRRRNIVFVVLGVIFVFICRQTLKFSSFSFTRPQQHPANQQTPVCLDSSA
jgi:hypothetical protein